MWPSMVNAYFNPPANEARKAFMQVDSSVQCFCRLFSQLVYSSPLFSTKDGPLFCSNLNPRHHVALGLDISLTVLSVKLRLMN